MNSEISERRRLETDVIVVGYGGAGASAAISAHDSGARVTILEKMAEGGGNTRLSAGVLLEPKGIEFVQYIEQLCGGTTDREMIEAFVTHAMKNREWLHALGAETEPRLSGIDVLYPSVPLPCWPNVPGGEFEARYQVKGEQSEAERGNGEKLWNVLSRAVQQRGIKVMTGTPVKDLITGESGEVIGVVAEREGQRVQAMAKRAVILSCGGFEHNEAMKQTFLPCQPFYAFGSLGNTGDGIAMTQRVGASLWHMTAIAAPFGFKAPEYPAAFYIRMHGGRFIYVDCDGKRFTNETNLEMHDMWREVSYFDVHRFSYPRIPMYAIFDETMRKRGPVKTPNLGANRDYDWSLDNSKEVAKGWIAKGKKINELARQLPLPASTLEDTIKRYNEFCKAGRDADFGRSRDSLEPIDQGPYYALKLWPCLLNTQGGPRRDAKARVIDREGRPVPRLYAAGELGSLWGFIYEAAGNLAECLALGRVAGQNAAAERPL